MSSLSELIPYGPPSLISCDKLTIHGRVVLERGVVFEGTVAVTNTSQTVAVVPPGVYCDQELMLP